jgi:hypothetical protein
VSESDYKVAFASRFRSHPPESVTSTRRDARHTERFRASSFWGERTDNAGGLVCIETNTPNEQLLAVHLDGSTRWLSLVARESIRARIPLTCLAECWFESFTFLE